MTRRLSLRQFAPRFLVPHSLIMASLFVLVGCDGITGARVPEDRVRQAVLERVPCGARTEIEFDSFRIYDGPPLERTQAVQSWANAHIVENAAYALIDSETGALGRDAQYTTRRYSYNDNGARLYLTYEARAGRIDRYFVTQGIPSRPAASARLEYCTAIPGDVAILDQETADGRANVLVRVTFTTSALERELIGADIVSARAHPLPGARELELGFRRLDSGEWRRE